ncbi:MAG: hypothetical protein ACC656_14575, partial [Candidatus Heimdallarchaeota archaeon]
NMDIKLYNCEYTNKNKNTYFKVENPIRVLDICIFKNHYFADIQLPIWKPILAGVLDYLVLGEEKDRLPNVVNVE